jgi:general secretion pathway protein A
MAIYLEFFGLERDPFGATPDPEFLFQTPGHKEALAQLVYAIQEKKGFILLTAEVGMGKTTLLQALRQELDSTIAVAYVSNSMLPFPGILEYMLEEFEIQKPGESHTQRLVTLQNFLLERHRAGQSTVLILDEAQNLYPQTLEQIRLLSNFETTKEKILQIVLVGQPELQARLDLPELRQLKQRISILCTIPPMTQAGSRNYIRTRLRLAGSKDLGIFTEEALSRICAAANGIPRVVNTICDHCMVIGYADQTRRIDRDIVEQALEYLGTTAPGRARRREREVRPERDVRPEREVRPQRQMVSLLRPAHRRARRRMSRTAWGALGVSLGIVAAVGAALWTHPWFVDDMLDLGVTQLADLARNLRGLVGK